MDEGQIVRRELVIARGDPPTLFDLIEKSLDQISGAIKVWAEADRLPSIASRRNIGPRTPFGGEGSDPVSVISAISQQH